MKAWLVTWEWMAPHAEVVNKIAAVINSRRSERFVADMVEHIYAHSNYNMKELLDIVKVPKRNPYKATRGEIIHGVPHGDRITCGHHPWLYARIVTDLTATTDKETALEIIKWKEPPIFKWKDKRKLQVEVTKPPYQECYRRTTSGKLNHTLRNRREEL